MLRNARCVEPGGVDRRDVFFSRADRLTYLSLAQLNVKDCEVRILAWCLMTNHANPEGADLLDWDFWSQPGHAAGWRDKVGDVEDYADIRNLRACTFSGKSYGTEDFVQHFANRFQRQWRPVGRPAITQVAKLLNVLNGTERSASFAKMKNPPGSGCPDFRASPHLRPPPSPPTNQINRRSQLQQRICRRLNPIYPRDRIKNNVPLLLRITCHRRPQRNLP